MCATLGNAWADCHFLGVYMANIAEYDAKIYFWGMVLFATVAFIALPLIAFIYLENRIITEQNRQDRIRNEKRIQKLEDELKGMKDVTNSRGNRSQPD